MAAAASATMQGIVGRGNQRWWKVQITQLEWNRTAMLPTARVLMINNSIRPDEAGNAAVRNEQQMCVSLQPTAGQHRWWSVDLGHPRPEDKVIWPASSCPQRFIPHCGRWMDGWMAGGQKCMPLTAWGRTRVHACTYCALPHNNSCFRHLDKYLHVVTMDLSVIFDYPSIDFLLYDFTSVKHLAVIYLSPNVYLIAR